jgi:hypothetical protein
MKENLSPSLYGEAQALKIKVIYEKKKALSFIISLGRIFKEIFPLFF